jgi:MFS family permease
MRSAQWTRSVVLFLIASFGSSGANMGVGTLLGLHVYDLTHRDFDLGLLGIAQFAPSLVLVLVTGSVADRYDRARIFAFGACGQAVAILALAGYAATNPTSAGPIFLIVIGYGVARAFSTSAQGPLAADMVPRDQLPWLVPRRTLVTRFSGIIGPILAGTLYEIEPWVSYVVIGSFLVLAGAASMLIPASPPLQLGLQTGVGERRNTFHEALEGWRFLRGSPVLFSAVTIDLFAVLFGGAVALLPAIAEERLGVGGSGVGLLRGAGGFGAGIAAIMLAWRPVRRRVGRALIVTVAVFGASTMTLGLTRHFLVALLAMMILSAADGVSVYIRQTLVPLVTPRDKLGRVSALSSVSIGASNELGAFESGVTGELLGSSRAVALGGAATLLVAGVYATVFPALRGFDRFPDRSPDASEGNGRVDVEESYP